MKRILPKKYQKKKSKGFSLVELMVVITITGVLSVGSIVLLSNFNTKNQINAGKEGVVSSLNLARNYAVTMQNNVSGELKYVRAEVSASGVVTVTSDSGTTYFSRDVTPDDVVISANPNVILFESYTGRLVRDGGGGVLLPYGAGENASFSVSSNQDTGSTSTVQVNSVGKISYSLNTSGGVVSTPGAGTTPTSPPAATNTPASPGYRCVSYEPFLIDVMKIVKPVQAATQPGLCGCHQVTGDIVYQNQSECQANCVNAPSCTNCGATSCVLNNGVVATSTPSPTNTPPPAATATPTVPAATPTSPPLTYRCKKWTSGIIEVNKIVKPVEASAGTCTGCYQVTANTPYTDITTCQANCVNVGTCGGCSAAYCLY